MISECDIVLADAPAPAPQARKAAIAKALARFEEKNRTAGAQRHQGSEHDGRLMPQTAIPPSRRSPVMPRVRYAIAASLVALMAGSATWVYVNEHLLVRDGHVPPPAALPAKSPPSVSAQVDQEASQLAPSPAAPQPAPAPVAPNKPETRVAAIPPPTGRPEPSPPKAETDTRRTVPTVTGRLDQAPVSSAAPLRARPAESFPQAEHAPRIDRIAPEPTPPGEPVGRDQFAGAQQNGFRAVREAPVSTFSIDVDTASYSFVRASLNRNVLPQPAAVRTEELINYFPYAYAATATASEPFRTTVAVFPSPWSAGRKIVHIGIRGYAAQPATRPAANLVFLIDTSGSMNAPNRLPLVKQSLAMLLAQLEAKDRVAIVTYAGKAGTALEPTAANEKTKILGVLERLEAGGSTAGAEGIRQAYALAERNFDPNGVNRVILATDGDFNVGITDKDELKGFIERQRGKGMFLSVLGFGMGNYNDALMQALAQNGNGAAAYIDTINEARKVLVEEATTTLSPIAKDVKIQVEFNPATVAEYRLIGYETRLLNRDDFTNDKVDAGDVSSGQTVTALYEIVPVGGPRLTDDLRYGEPARAAQPTAPAAPAAAEYAFVKIRYKLPASDASALISTPVDRSSEHARFEEAPNEARFATAVAAFAEILRGGRFIGAFTYDDVLRIASTARGDDPFGYRSEFLQLVRAAKTASTIPSSRQ
jgi:Ca-activated chloride channel family protein